MKISTMKLYKVPPRWLFLKLETDEGYEGWGEPVVEGSADAARAAVEEFREYLLGSDPLRIEDHWQAMYRGGFYRGGPERMSAIAGIDQALWDIKGRYYGAPVYELLGGACRQRIKVYRWIGGDRPSQVGDAAEEACRQGYQAVKMNACGEMHYIDRFEKVEEACRRVAAIRERVGNKLDIAVDFHGRVHRAMAKLLARELEQFHLMFIEEPVLSQNNEALREIARAACIPVATGERMFSRWEFRQLLQDGYADIIQPDLSHAGGISECRKIAAMAEAYDVAVAPHCPLGPAALAACFQLDACTPNVFIQEQSLGIHYNREADLLDYLKDRSVFTYENGFAALPEGPGLGIRLDEELLKERAREDGAWKNPLWRNDDGTVAEW